MDEDPPPNLVLRQARRLVVAVAGVTMLLVGVVLLFMPGPGTAALLAGLALLATEFVWARRLLAAARARARDAVDKARGRPPEGR